MSLTSNPPNSMTILSDILDPLQKNLRERFQGNFKALILYGSWSRGTAREDSDVDLLAVFEKVDPDTRKNADDMVSDLRAEKMVTLVCAGLEEFRKETIPLYTAVKREGKIVCGDVDLSIAPDAPEVKYAGFFKKSCDFERQKIEAAEELLQRGMGSGIADFCFIASKHAIQAVLAMHGEGYSSKVAVLLPLAEKRFGKEIAATFRKLFELYIQSEYGLESLTEEEARRAVEYAKADFFSVRRSGEVKIA